MIPHAYTDTKFTDKYLIHIFIVAFLQLDIKVSPGSHANEESGEAEEI